MLELFQGPLCSVRFADVDAAGLAQLAAEVEAAASEVEAHEAALVELRQSLAQRHEALLALAHQALAYARVYAENNDEALLETIGAIALPRAAKARKPGRAGSRDAGSAEPRGESPPALDAAPGADAEARAADPGDPSDEATSDEARGRGGRRGRPRAAHAEAS